MSKLNPFKESLRAQNLKPRKFGIIILNEDEKDAKQQWDAWNAWEAWNAWDAWNASEHDR